MDNAVVYVPFLVFICGMLLKIEKRLSRIEIGCPHITPKAVEG